MATLTPTQKPSKSNSMLRLFVLMVVINLALIGYIVYSAPAPLTYSEPIQGIVNGTRYYSSRDVYDTSQITPIGK